MLGREVAFEVIDGKVIKALTTSFGSFAISENGGLVSAIRSSPRKRGLAKGGSCLYDPIMKGY